MFETASWGRRVLALFVDWGLSTLVVIGIFGWADVFVVMQVIDPPLHHTTRILSAEVARPEASRLYGMR